MINSTLNLWTQAVLLSYYFSCTYLGGFVTMSRVLFLSLERFQVRWKACPGGFRSYPLLTSRPNYPCNLSKDVFYQQSARAYAGLNGPKRPSFSKSFAKTKSKLWVLGLGAGFVLAYSLKHHAYNSEPCSAETAYVPQTDLKYAEVIEISRDLVRRIKVQVYVDPRVLPNKFWFIISLYPVLIL